MDIDEVASALGGLTEAVNGLRRDMQEFKEQRKNLDARVGKLETKHAWAKGAAWSLGGVVGVLGLDRLANFIHR